MTKTQQNKAAVAKAKDVRAFLNSQGYATNGRRALKDVSVGVLDGVVYVSVNPHRTVAPAVLDALRAQDCKVTER